MMKKCPKCKIYTLEDKCPECNVDTIVSQPPKFSIEKEKKYSKYRRKALKT